MEGLDFHSFYLEDCLINISKWVHSLSGQVEEQEQYMRRNCLLLHRIIENRDEKTDDSCIATINKHHKLLITETDIERTDRIRKTEDAGQKSRPIIVKFVRYNDWKNLFNRRKVFMINLFYD